MSTLGGDPTDPVRVLDEDGSVVGEVPDLPDDRLREMYRWMKLARELDRRAVSLQRQGRMGTYPPMAGQEGAQVGSALALGPEDWLLPSYREHLSMLVQGVPLDDVLRYWMGDERGSRMPPGVEVLPVTIPIATHIPQATGVAWAAKLRGDDAVALCQFGDGATSEGDFHEGLNFAGVFDAPAVFLCNNNQWAISVPRERQTASDTIAEKASAYGIDGVQVDGMDPLATYAVVRDAVETARDPDEGERRPTLVEAVQYRFGAHTTADDPTVYRDAAEVERWKAKDPIPRFETFLRETGRLDDERIADVEREVERTVGEAVDAAEATTRPEPSAMFEHVFERQTTHLREQQERFEAFRDRHGDEAFRRE